MTGNAGNFSVHHPPLGAARGGWFAPGWPSFGFLQQIVETVGNPWWGPQTGSTKGRGRAVSLSWDLAQVSQSCRVGPG